MNIVEILLNACSYDPTNILCFPEDILHECLYIFVYVVDMYLHPKRIVSIVTLCLTDGVEAIILFILCTGPWVPLIVSTARTGELLYLGECQWIHA